MATEVVNFLDCDCTFMYGDIFFRQTHFLTKVNKQHVTLNKSKATGKKVFYHNNYDFQELHSASNKAHPILNLILSYLTFLERRFIKNSTAVQYSSLFPLPYEGR